MIMSEQQELEAIEKLDNVEKKIDLLLAEYIRVSRLNAVLESENRELREEVRRLEIGR